MVLQNDGRGVGLMRSEFLFLASDTLPDEETQYRAYRSAENEDIVGEWELLDIGLKQCFIDSAPSTFFTMEEAEIRSLIKPRKRFAHKGTFGHGLLIAGSYGMAGASILSAKACLRSGIGLLTVHAPIHNHDLLQTTVPEAIVHTDIQERYFAQPLPFQ